MQNTPPQTTAHCTKVAFDSGELSLTLRQHAL
jgi:hypothetical protein